jgi:hypothetical protein
VTGCELAFRSGWVLVKRVVTYERLQIGRYPWIVQPDFRHPLHLFVNFRFHQFLQTYISGYDIVRKTVSVRGGGGGGTGGTEAGLAWDLQLFVIIRQRIYRGVHLIPSLSIFYSDGC